MDQPAENYELELQRLQMWFAARAAVLEAKLCCAVAVGDLTAERDLKAQLAELDQDRPGLPVLARHNLDLHSRLHWDTIDDQR